MYASHPISSFPPSSHTNTPLPKQGVGETLRGTLNSTVDRRFHASPEQQAYNDRVLQGGRQEIESGHLSEHSRQQGGLGTGAKGILRKSGGGSGGGGQGGLRVVNE